MLAAQRHNEILNLIKVTGNVRTNELSPVLGCTEETIRRDLDKLAKQGLLVRTHGGAISQDERNTDLDHHMREQRNIKEKNSIARKAADFLNPNETIMLDESSTALAMANFLPHDMPLKVVTSSLLVAQKIATHENHQLIQLGGTLDKVSMSFQGILTELMISRLRIDRFFFSAKGIDPDQGASEPSEDRARMKQHILSYSKWNCALLDHTKIGIKADYFFVAPRDIDVFITDKKAKPEMMHQFKDAGIETCVS